MTSVRAIALWALALANCGGGDATKTAKRGAAIAGETKASSGKAEPKATPADQSPFETVLAKLDREIEFNLGRTKKAPKSWLVVEQAAGRYLARARLSGDYDDYAKAEQLIEKAFTISGQKAGPFMTRAGLNFTLHRLDRVGPDLERAGKRVLMDDVTQAQISGLRADLDLQLGRYPQALEGFEQALKVRETTTALSRLAHYRWKTGVFDEAEELYRKALAKHRPQEDEPTAWYHLQLGLMDLDRGRYDDALAHYRDAEGALGGYWLIEEHIAEILTLQDKTEEALASYHSIVERTGNPEFMDAIAGIHAEAGKAEEAKRWTTKARRVYESQLERFPEAAYGHALGHFLEFGDDAARVVELAEKNHALRPNAQAKELLAQAYLKAGRVDQAKKVIEQALKTPWDTADLHATASEVYEASGDAKRAEAELAKAKAINPHAGE